MCGEFHSPYLEQLSALGLSIFEEEIPENIRVDRKIDITLNGNRKAVGASLIKSGEFSLKMLQLSD
jgi:hypothetical protein